MNALGGRLINWNSQLYFVLFYIFFSSILHSWSAAAQNSIHSLDDYDLRFNIHKSHVFFTDSTGIQLKNIATSLINTLKYSVLLSVGKVLLHCGMFPNEGGTDCGGVTDSSV